ncbi:hypothetical protein Acr_24g0013340 [Actinidia rufa]|uniref:Uncharacterized protein n=1 Tax=Actinidia rufa TaxID=165716 RepID=A0A7J0GX62_9ERIC|nr:hypothetical protein Acr_24g0013340 [Actinidia rufa]
MRSEAIVFSLRFLNISTFHICFCYGIGSSNIMCLETESQALLKLKRDLKDPLNGLSSWAGAEGLFSLSGLISLRISHLESLMASIPEKLSSFRHNQHENFRFHSYMVLENIFPGPLPFISSMTDWVDLSNDSFSASVVVTQFRLKAEDSCCVWQYTVPVQIETMALFSSNIMCLEIERQAVVKFKHDPFKSIDCPLGLLSTAVNGLELSATTLPVTSMKSSFVIRIVIRIFLLSRMVSKLTQGLRIQMPSFIDSLMYLILSGVGIQ